MNQASDRDPPDVLLLPGFWHGTWCWNDVLARLTASGRRAVAVDLAGHGMRARRPAAALTRPFDEAAFATEPSAVADVDLDRAGDLLISQIRDLSRRGPIVAVAHSFAGVVLTRAVQTVPELVSHAVYVAAMMPSSQVPGIAYLQRPEQQGDRVAPLLRGDPAVIGALRLDTAARGEYRAALRATWYADVDDQHADAAIGLLTPDAPLGVATGSTELTGDGWGSVRRTYVRCAEDWSFRPRLQDLWIAEADAAFPDSPTTVVEMATSHSPFLSQPERLTEVIAAVR